MREVQDKLFELQDKEYAKFQSKLIPTVDPATVIGVRTPELRKYAKELSKSQTKDLFLAELPHTYFDENQLHAFLISLERDYDLCIEQLERFLPYINNWATCDQLSPKVFKRHRMELEQMIDKWILSGHTYTVRFGIGMLMEHYLDDAFDVKYLEKVAAVRSEEYYVNMMIAWFFATALSKRYDAALPFLTEGKLDVWTHNKAIQKARESRKVTPEQKAYLQTCKK